MLNTTYEAPKTKDEVAVEAHRLYSKWTEEQGIHSNRYPSFFELSAAAQQDWNEKAYISLTQSPPKSAPKLEIVAVKAKTAWPTDSEVYAELIRRKIPGTVMHISSPAVSDVMSAVNKLACASLQRDVFIQGMQAACNGLVKERDALIKERDETLRDFAESVDSQRDIFAQGIEAACDSLRKERDTLSLQLADTIKQLEAAKAAALPPVAEEEPGFPSMMDWELGCDVSFRGETLRRIVTVGELVEMMKSNRNIIIHHGTEKTGVRDEDQEFEITLPKGWRLLHEGTAGLIHAISAAIRGNQSEVSKATMISVSKFLERLDYTHGPVKLKLKKDVNGTLELENGREGKTKYSVRCD